MELEREVAAPASVVWAVMTDLEGAAERISGIERVERLDGGPSLVLGTRWRETRKMFGKSATQELEVTAIEPGQSYTVETDSAGTHYRSVLGIEPTGEHSSRLWMTFDVEPVRTGAKVLAATIGKLFEGSTRKVMQQDLDDIAAAAEPRSA